MTDPLATRDAREVSIDAKRLAEGRDRPIAHNAGYIPTALLLSEAYQRLNDNVLKWQNTERRWSQVLGILLRHQEDLKWLNNSLPTLDGEWLAMVREGAKALEPAVTKARQRQRWARTNLSLADRAKEDFVEQWRKENV